MQVIVTRPAQEAQRWVQRLRERGHDAQALPLVAIGPAPDPAAVRQARVCLAGCGAALFVSANAVRGLLAGPAFAWPGPPPRAWAPGPGTQAALLAAGVPAAAIDAPAADARQFDSEALWAQVAGQLRGGDRLLLVRGGAGAGGRGEGREWLSQQLAAAGVAVEEVVAYTRQPPAWDAAQRQLAQDAAAGGAVWLFSSSESAYNLARLLPEQDWAGAQAVATHPRIAQAVRALGFGAVRECRPGFTEVVASIESTG